MNKIITASDVVPAGQRAVVVFTRGDKLIHDSKGDGSTGNWKVNLNRLDQVEKVIIYLRDERQHGGQILMGSYVGYGASPEAGRYIILFSRLQQIGTTSSNWRKFAHMWQTPVTFIGEF